MHTYGKLSSERNCLENCREKFKSDFYPRHAMLAWILAVVVCLAARIELIFSVQVSLDLCYGN